MGKQREEAWEAEPAEDATQIRRRRRGLERRTTKRLPIEIDVDVESTGAWFRATTGDLSPRGMFIATERLLYVGSRVALSFRLPNGVVLMVFGAVRWRREEHGPSGAKGFGVAFSLVSLQVQDLLDAFCAVRVPLYCEDGA